MSEGATKYTHVDLVIQCTCSVHLVTVAYRLLYVISVHCISLTSIHSVTITGSKFNGVYVLYKYSEHAVTTVALYAEISQFFLLMAD
jgi:hypothetical protein